jgi:adenylyltransferase/sulfurtransferase
MSDETSPVVVRMPKEDRYSSLRLIDWWEQDKIAGATILVAGAGAIGNEVIRNLALLGVGHILIADFDRVETGNLSRSSLFRDEDVGRPKAEAAADGARRFNPEITATPVQGDFRLTLGAGVIRRVDAVIGCLDSREARLALNRLSYRVRKPWVDGAIHSLLGEARVFWPDRGACYECTLTPADFRLIAERYSCQSIRKDFVPEPRIPTTPTIAAIIGAIQVQETLKILHGLHLEPGVALVFNGLTNDSYSIRLPVRAECFSHEFFDEIEERADLGNDSTLQDVLAAGSLRLGGDATLVLGSDLVVGRTCSCGREGADSDEIAPSLTLTARDLKCPACGAMRAPDLRHVLDGSEPFAGLSLSGLGVAPLEILRLRSGGRTCYFELTKDLARADRFPGLLAKTGQLPMIERTLRPSESAD